MIAGGRRSLDHNLPSPEPNRGRRSQSRLPNVRLAEHLSSAEALYLVCGGREGYRREEIPSLQEVIRGNENKLSGRARIDQRRSSYQA